MFSLVVVVVRVDVQTQQAFVLVRLTVLGDYKHVLLRHHVINYLLYLLRRLLSTLQVRAHPAFLQLQLLDHLVHDVSLLHRVDSRLLLVFTHHIDDCTVKFRVLLMSNLDFALTVWSDGLNLRFLHALSLSVQSLNR